MKTTYQIVINRKYGNPTIIYESKTYDEVKAFINKNKELLLNKVVWIQQATIIKNNINN